MTEEQAALHEIEYKSKLMVTLYDVILQRANECEETNKGLLDLLYLACDTNQSINDAARTGLGMEVNHV